MLQNGQTCATGDTDGEIIRQNKHKVPPSYSLADETARALNGRRDDESRDKLNSRL